MKRKIIKIEETKCNGCGACVTACHEGAIEMIGGKARLTREDYCDGLGDCLPACPTGAITFEEKEIPCGCQGTRSHRISREEEGKSETAAAAPGPDTSAEAAKSCLSQWPVQIRLVPVRAAYFDQADLLIAADCTAYAYGRFHNEFIRGRITLIGCPKLDEVDYAEKLTAILRDNASRSLTVVRMEVPCCSGIEQAAKRAIQASGRQIPCQTVILSTDGKIL